MKINNLKKQLRILFAVCIYTLGIACNDQQKSDSLIGNEWLIDSQQDWETNMAKKSNIVISEGKLEPNDSLSTFQSTIKKFSKKQSISSITFSQSSEWLNWKPVNRVGPENLGDAPVALQTGEGNYWMFGRYKQSKSQDNATFQDTVTTLEGYDVALRTTPFKNQFNAPGGLKPGKGGYHAWQSKDMVHWVHHGPVSENFSRWVTTAEYVDGKLYLYYDFPNDQDPHLYIDEDLTDGIPGKNMGMVFKDPSHGSDCAIIRDLEGNFHIITEDWSPINASKHAWDSPLAVHAVSPDGINDFKILNPPVDERTKPTGEIGTYKHPHWVKEDPKNYSTRVAEYEQYYLFADYDQAGKHGSENMSIAWFTSSDINKPFTFCGNIGKGHPDPDIMFAEGKFYLMTQTKYDYISSGPWVESVEVRMGVDTTNDNKIDTWSDWQVVTEHYDYIDGFAKQVEKISAKLDLSDLPEGFGKNESKPILDKIVVLFDE